MSNELPAKTFTYPYPHPAVTVDCVVFGLDSGDLKVLLIQRDIEPFRLDWALPGGFIQMGEDLDAAARRELQEETGVKDLFLEQLYTFGAVNRDPRERVITVAYYAIVNLFDHPVRPDTDARSAAWFSLDALPSLAFDHTEIVRLALARLQGKIRYQPIGFEFLPRKFTLTQLQKLYETILRAKLDKRNFRKKILATNILEPLDELEANVAHRAAKLYRFDQERYQSMKESGFNFEL